MRKFADNQIAFDFSMRGHRLRLLDRIVLPKLPGTTPAGLIAVLRNLDSHAREKAVCRLNTSTIAKETQMGERSVYRALSALESLEVVERKFTGRSTAYRISWIRIADFDPRDEVQEDPELCHHGGAALPPCHTSSATVAEQPCHGGRATEAPTEAPSQPPPETGRWQEAEAAVAGVGVTDWRGAVTSARLAGVDPGYVLACVAYVARSAGAFDGGALKRRLERAAAFSVPDDPATWPPPKPPSARETVAFRLLARVRSWCVQHGRPSEIRTTFESAARSSDHGPFTQQEIDRAFFEASRTPDFFPEHRDGKPDFEVPAQT